MIGRIGAEILLGFYRLDPESRLPLHEWARRTLKFAFVPQFAAAIRRRFGSEVQVLTRHSLENPGGFHIAMSDVDFSIFIPEAALSSTLTRDVADFFARARTLFPFVGELEIYSSREVAALGAISVDSKKTFDQLRPMRKILWLTTALPAAPAAYHAAKNARAVARALIEVGARAGAVAGDGVSATLARGLEKLAADFESPTEAPPPPYFSRFFGAWIDETPSRPDAIVLSSRARATIAAALPDAATALFGLGSDHLRTIRRELAEIERIRIVASLRATRMPPPWAAEWLDYLHASAA